MITVRAKSTIKITTGKSNIDLNYQKDTPVQDVTNDMVHALIQAVGTVKAKELIADKISNYKEDYKGLGE